MCKHMNEFNKCIIKTLSEAIADIQKFTPDCPKKDEAIKRIMEGIFWLKDIG
nr:MAG TPA: hypothetical protein [Caudoviricetes sp.]